jgi:heme/copper-type cytochrome/quinol oxidase subunit 1
MGTRRGRVATTAVVGLVALVLGTVLALRARSTSYGWFAYAPLDPDPHLPRLVSDREVLAWAAAVLGLVLLAGCLGYLLGSRSARESSSG